MEEQRALYTRAKRREGANPDGARLNPKRQRNGTDSTTKRLTRGHYTLKYSASASSDTETLPALCGNCMFTMNFASDLRHFVDSFLANIGSRTGSRIRFSHAETTYYEVLYAYPTKQYRWKIFVEKLSLVLDTCTGPKVFSFKNKSHSNI
jgi:hypothetical protein